MYVDDYQLFFFSEETQQKFKAYTYRAASEKGGAVTAGLGLGQGPLRALSIYPPLYSLPAYGLCKKLRFCEDGRYRQFFLMAWLQKYNSLTTKI